MISEMLSDIQTYDKAKQRIAQGDDEIIPFAIIKRRLAGEQPVKIWREYRQMTQEMLAETSVVSRSMIGAIESGHKKGSILTLRKLADALDTDLENITG